MLITTDTFRFCTYKSVLLVRLASADFDDSDVGRYSDDSDVGDELGTAFPSDDEFGDSDDEQGGARFLE